ncbi:AtpZ/AtpI family protein [Dyadobacter flavalbus]|uniref:AtpZ/AtpI family protein n=1 Tax=Dyadobacter flavalbus TaxID=2579942 RepID=A0A5M8R0C8_9BACT|nr:AtpZ/AtpI family protein [Dyadobacter flavalbus]KAA6441081.1 AtpZ/AtpI family protein [Dyadobacter flavalbus]
MKKNNPDPFSEERKSALKKQSSGFLKYSGMATQMLGTILLFTYGGYKLDEWQQNKVPVWTLILSLVSIAASLYMLIRSFNKK